MGVSENNILQTDFEQKTLLQRNTILSPEVSGKKNPPPPQKSNGPLPLISAG